MPGEKDTELRDQLADLCQAKEPDYDKIAKLISKADKTKVRHNEYTLHCEFLLQAFLNINQNSNVLDRDFR